RRMELERELACDEWALGPAGHPHDYALCLARIAEFVGDSSSRPSQVLGGLAGPSSTFQRIRHLVGRSRRRQRPVVAACLTVLMLGLIVERANLVPALAIGEPSRGFTNSGAGYLRGLRDLGFGGLTPRQIVELKVGGVKLEYVREMLSAGLSPTPNDLVYLFHSGARFQYAAAMHRLVPTATASDIALLADDKVAVPYVRMIATVKPAALDAASLIRLHDAGVGIDYLRELASFGYGLLTVNQVVAFHIVGIDAAFLGSATVNGRKHPSAAELVRQKYGTR
ncbi:MAG TPA: hypothetical protein VJP76_08015, partial [Candidatus Tumulicola sp.]|nr:hypothetical protein [Candidatus Tumulicola sp.]